ncbi:MAG: flagellar motor protein MotB [bacterium]|nr:flagellar motor protein MotB [bacterium]
MTILGKKNNSLLQSPSTSWMITFGDLLTLLLCFFISLISFNGTKIKGLVEKRHQNNSGTQIAKIDRETKPRWVSFSSEEVNSDALMGILKERILAVSSKKEIVITDSYLEVCSRNDELPAEWNWHESMTQALKIKGQIVDSFSLQSESVKVRVLGPNCGALNGKKTDSEVTVGFIARDA